MKGKERGCKVDSQSLAEGNLDELFKRPFM